MVTLTCLTFTQQVVRKKSTHDYYTDAIFYQSVGRFEDAEVRSSGRETNNDRCVSLNPSQQMYPMKRLEGTTKNFFPLLASQLSQRSLSTEKEGQELSPLPLHLRLPLHPPPNLLFLELISTLLLLMNTDTKVNKCRWGAGPDPNSAMPTTSDRECLIFFGN